MLQIINFPLCMGSLSEYGSWDELRVELRALGCGGLEGIWAGEDFPAGLPDGLVTGYHLLFYPRLAGLFPAISSFPKLFHRGKQAGDRQRIPAFDAV